MLRRAVIGEIPQSERTSSTSPCRHSCRKGPICVVRHRFLIWSISSSVACHRKIAFIDSLSLVMVYSFSERSRSNWSTHVRIIIKYTYVYRARLLIVSGFQKLLPMWI